jgi:hypothetical protein
MCDVFPYRYFNNHLILTVTNEKEIKGLGIQY